MRFPLKFLLLRIVESDSDDPTHTHTHTHIFTHPYQKKKNPKNTDQKKLNERKIEYFQEFTIILLTFS